MKQCNIFPFWEKLTDEEKQQISNECYTEVYEKGTIMHKADDTCVGLMAVVSGQLRVYILSDEGREVTLFRVNTGEVCVLSAFSARRRGLWPSDRRPRSKGCL